MSVFWKPNSSIYSSYERYQYDCSNGSRSTIVLQTEQILIIWSSKQHPGFRLTYVIGQSIGFVLNWQNFFHEFGNRFVENRKIFRTVSPSWRILSRKKLFLTRCLFGGIILQADYNECETNLSECEQLCTNRIDGYECRCRPGYSLEANGHGCRPKLAQFAGKFGETLFVSKSKLTPTAPKLVNS